jgi:hypothetical protein
MNGLATMTNATKAQIIVVINALLALLQSFGVDLTDEQQGAILILINAGLGLWVGLTYKDSTKRVP